jgi:hypothetical protein
MPLQLVTFWTLSIFLFVYGLLNVAFKISRLLHLGYILFGVCIYIYIYIYIYIHTKN